MAPERRHRKDSPQVTFNGQTKYLTEWVKELGLCQGLISRRYRYGKRGHDLFKPVRPKTSKETGAPINNPTYTDTHSNKD